MNVVISDTAEYGNYLFTHSCVPLLQDFMAKIDTDVIGKTLEVKDNCVDNQKLIDINKQIQDHPVERIGETLRAFMDNMKAINA
jgi:ketol-acid reductoisomerase